MTERDEFLYNQLKGGRSLYAGLSIVYGLCTAAAAIMALFAYPAGGWQALLTICGMGLWFAGMTYTSWKERESYIAALTEIGDDPTGVDTCRTYSRDTAYLIARKRMPAKTFLQQSIAYGAIAITLLGFGLFCFVLSSVEFDGLMFPLLGAGLIAGGLILSALTFGALRNWRAAKRLETMQ